MIKYALKKWDENKDVLRNAIQQTEKDKRCFWDYNDIVKLVCSYIFNENVSDEDPMIDVDGITMIDNGSYQGTLLFMLPFDVDQPAEYEYLMTYVGYGSCSGCDTLQRIQADDEDDDETEKDLVDSYLSICKDIVSNTIRPYNQGWRNNGMFDSVDSLSSRDSIREIKIITKNDLYDIMFEWIKPKLDECVASGGDCIDGSTAGGLYWHLYTDVGYRVRSIGARLCYGDEHLGYNIWTDGRGNVNIKIRRNSIEFIEESEFLDFSKEAMKELYYKIMTHMLNCGALNEEDIK